MDFEPKELLPTKTRVERFQTARGALFLCLACGKPIQELYYGTHHVSSGFHCQGCGAYYTVEWKEPVEHSVIEMTQYLLPTHEIEMTINEARVMRGVPEREL